MTGGVATAGALATGQTAQAKRGALAAEHRRIYDVAVVGAGLAGLNAATAIRAAGRSVVVLEARHRVGDATLTIGWDRGRWPSWAGSRAGPGQDKLLGLAKELGVETFPTYSTGQSVYYAGGRVQTYSGDVPPASPASLVELEAAIVEFNRMASSVPAGAPWKAPNAGVWDQETCATWITANLHTAEGRNLAELAIRGVYGEEAKQISLLDLLQGITGVGGDFNTLIGSAQSIRFVGGPQQLSEKLAHRLGRGVRLGVAVRAIELGRQAIVHSQQESFRAHRVIVSIPKTLAGRITFEPAAAARPGPTATAPAQWLGREGQRDLQSAVLAGQGSQRSGRVGDRTDPDHV